MAMLRLLITCWVVAAGSAAYAQQAFSAPVAGDEATGEAIFSAECRVCHGGLIAPTLRGVVGRPIASIDTFGGYSAALKGRRNETWTDENLAAFLASPSGFAPGTGKTKNLSDEQSRADVIAFLRSLPPPR